MIKKKDVFYGDTNTGRQRENNEDAFIAFYSSDQKYVIAAVIDGVGGYEGGEIAAAIAQEVLTEAFKVVNTDAATQMKEAFYLTNDRIYAESLKNRDLDHMACVLTMVIADIENNSFHYAHVGDTRLYLYRDHSLAKVTRDHSFVGFLEDSKRISEAEAMHHPKRNEINKALGFESDIRASEAYIDTGVSPFLPGDLLLLCSDGLSDMLDRKAMSEILEQKGNLGSKIKNLIEAANEAGGKDNITAILIANTKVAKEHEATKPVFQNKIVEQIEEKKQEIQSANNITTAKKKRYSGLVAGIVIGILLLSTGLLFWKSNKRKETSLAVIVKKQERNPVEKRLEDSIHINSKLFLSDSVYSNPIIISDTLLVTKDSILIEGNGLTLRADSSFKGPAIQIPASNRLTEFSNVTFENFSTVIQSANKNVIFKNVRFINCPIPFQYVYSSPYSFVWNGILSDTIAKKDSIPQRTSRRHE